MKIKGVINIISDKNFRCIVRHAVAQMAKTQYVLFIDDDLELRTDLSSRFINALETEPEAVTGIFGNNVDPNADTGMLYASGGRFGFEKSEFYRYVDIVIGRCHLVKRKFLMESFIFINTQLFPLENFNVIRDDVILNLSIQAKTKIPGLLIPIDPETDYRDLADHNAVCNMKSHYLMRSFIINEFMTHGWRAGANKGRFLKHNIETGGDIVQLQNLVVKLQRQVEKMNLKGAHRLYAKINRGNIGKYPYLIPQKLKYNLAGLYREEGNFERAYALYLNLIKDENPEDSDLKAMSHFHLGMQALKSNNKENAKAHFLQCLDLMPHHQEASRQLKELLESNY